MTSDDLSEPYSSTLYIHITHLFYYIDGNIIIEQNGYGVDLIYKK